MIKRFLQPEFDYLIENFPAVGIVGARQVGKTTLAKAYYKGQQKSTVYVDLERASDRTKLSDPELFLKNNEGKTVILDEIQHMPGLFPLLRSLIDDDRRPGRYIILGSASPELLRQSAESLAGRIAYLHLHTLNLLEIPSGSSWQALWVRGGFPEPFLKDDSKFSSRWQENFINNYIQRDLPQLGLPAQPQMTRRLLQMLTSANGSVVNYSMLSKSLGITVPTVKSYVDFLVNAYLVFELPPWSENIKKRVVKSSKIYYSDSGLLHFLLGISDFNQVMGHMMAGLSWEGFVISQVRSVLHEMDEIYFYRTQDGAEIDLLVRRNNKWLLGAEIKLTNSPTISKGTHIAMNDLGLKHLLVITPGSDNYQLSDKIEVINLMEFLERVAGMRG